MTVAHSNLLTYYNAMTSFKTTSIGDWSLDELESLTPGEFEIYMIMVNNIIHAQKDA